MKSLVFRAVRTVAALGRPTRRRNLKLLNFRGERAETFTIEEATSAHIPVIARVHVKSWNDAYARLGGHGAVRRVSRAAVARSVRQGRRQLVLPRADDGARRARRLRQGEPDRRVRRAQQDLPAARVSAAGLRAPAPRSSDGALPDARRVDDVRVRGSAESVVRVLREARRRAVARRKRSQELQLVHLARPAAARLEVREMRNDAGNSFRDLSRRNRWNESCMWQLQLRLGPGWARRSSL